MAFTFTAEVEVETETEQARRVPSTAGPDQATAMVTRSFAGDRTIRQAEDTPAVKQVASFMVASSRAVVVMGSLRTPVPNPTAS